MKPRMLKLRRRGKLLLTRHNNRDYKILRGGVGEWWFGVESQPQFEQIGGKRRCVGHRDVVVTTALKSVEQVCERIVDTM